MQYYYLLTLILSLGGLLYADHKYSAVLFPRARKGLKMIAAGIVFFLAWDIAGIVMDVFSTNPDRVSGLYIVTKDLPVEEFFFLGLLCYLTLLCWRAVCSRIS